jgi:hypothetical protein
MSKDYTEDWTDRQKEFCRVLTKIIENGTYTSTMNNFIHSWWKAEKGHFNVTENRESLAWSEAWDVLRELNEKIGKGIDTKFPVLSDVMNRFNLHAQVKGDSWQEIPLNSLMGDFSEECEEFWDACPDRIEAMYTEAIDVILIMLMVATRLKDALKMEVKAKMEKARMVGVDSLKRRVDGEDWTDEEE